MSRSIKGRLTRLEEQSGEAGKGAVSVVVLCSPASKPASKFSGYAVAWPEGERIHRGRTPEKVLAGIEKEAIHRNLVVIASPHEGFSGVTTRESKSEGETA